MSTLNIIILITGIFRWRQDIITPSLKLALAAAPFIYLSLLSTHGSMFFPFTGGLFLLQGYRCCAGAHPTPGYYIWVAQSGDRNSLRIEPGTSRSPDERSPNWANRSACSVPLVTSYVSEQVHSSRGPAAAGSALLAALCLQWRHMCPSRYTRLREQQQLDPHCWRRCASNDVICVRAGTRVSGSSSSWIRTVTTPPFSNPWSDWSTRSARTASRPTTTTTSCSCSELYPQPLLRVYPGGWNHVTMSRDWGANTSVFF